MQQDFVHSFERILTAVEQDDSLKNGEIGSESGAGGTALAHEPERPEEAMASGLGAMLSHPELLSKLPLLLRTVQTLSEPLGKPSEKPPETPTALLCALRPYLSETRQRVLDTMIKASKLAETIRSMQ